MEDKHEYECLICLDEVDDEYTYVKCHNCNKLFHEDCMLTWKYKQNKGFSVCVHCTKDDLLLHKIINNAHCKVKYLLNINK